MASKGRYSIGSVAQMTGTSTHTLRAWERRYGFPVPLRTEGGARRYTDDDLERLKLVTRLLAAGHRAGDVVALPPEDLRARLERHGGEDTVAGVPSVDEILAMLMADDLAGARQRLRHAVVMRGPKGFLIDVAGPLMESVGRAWAEGRVSIQQEHLMSELVSSQLRVLSSAYVAGGGRPRAVLTTLEGETHRLGLDMAGLYLSMHGVDAVLLGPSTPVNDIAGAAVSQRADVVGISVSKASAGPATAGMIAELLEVLPRRVDLWVGGEGASHPSLDDLPIRRVHGWRALDEALGRWRQTR